MATFIAVDTQPFSAVENTRFQDMLWTLEPRSKIPSETYFTDIVVPALYNKTEAQLEQSVSVAPTVALTSGCWTWRTTTTS